MDFLLQVDETGFPIADFVYETAQSLDYQQWYTGEAVQKLRLTKDGLNNWHDYRYLEPFIPVGTVEFVHDFMKSVHKRNPLKPLNIPQPFFDNGYFLNREVRILTGTELQKFNGKSERYFIKSNDIVKGFTYFGSVKDLNKKKLKSNEHYIVSDPLDILSEWRCFVFRGKLVGLNNYSGDFCEFPNVDKINEIIRIYERYGEHIPPAYTVDVAISNNGQTIISIIEFHHFYSCGFYGFSDCRIIPQMLSQWYNWFLYKN